MGHALAKKVQATPAQAKPEPARPKLKLVPVLKLGVNKNLLEQAPVQMLCRASSGGSCYINCTTGVTTDG